MSIDLLHERIRKLKNPSMIDFGVKADSLPPHLLDEEGTYLAAYTRFCRELLDGLKGYVPAVRFSLSDFALLGPDGLTQLQKLLIGMHFCPAFLLSDAIYRHLPEAQLLPHPDRRYDH